MGAFFSSDDDPTEGGGGATSGGDQWLSKLSGKDFRSGASGYSLLSPPRPAFVRHESIGLALVHGKSMTTDGRTTFLAVEPLNPLMKVIGPADLYMVDATRVEMLQLAIRSIDPATGKVMMINDSGAEFATTMDKLRREAVNTPKFNAALDAFLRSYPQYATQYRPIVEIATPEALKSV